MEQKLSVLGIDIAKQGLHRHPFKLRDILRCACAQRARNGRLVGTRRAAKGPLHRGVGPNRHVTLRTGLGSTEDAHQGIEEHVHRTVPHGLWHDGALLAEGGKETLPA